MWAAPAFPMDVPKLPCDLGQPCTLLASAPHLFNKGSHHALGTPLQFKPTVAALRQADPDTGLASASVQGTGQELRDRVGRGGVGWGPAGRGGAGLSWRAGGRSLAPRTVGPHRRLFVFISNSIFKTRPAAAELSGSPFLCLHRSPPPLAPRTSSNKPCDSDGKFISLSLPFPRSQAAPRLMCQPLHPDYLETPISKRHLNSDVNELIRCVNELKATQIKLMRQ